MIKISCVSFVFPSDCIWRSNYKVSTQAALASFGHDHPVALRFCAESTYSALETLNAYPTAPTLQTRKEGGNRREIRHNTSRSRNCGSSLNRPVSYTRSPARRLSLWPLRAMRRLPGASVGYVHLRRELRYESQNDRQGRLASRRSRSYAIQDI